LITHEAEVIAALGQALRQRVGASRYDLWFDKKTQLSLSTAGLTVGVPSLFYQDWLQKTFAGEVQSAARDVFGQALSVHFVIDPALLQTTRPSEEPAEPVMHAAGQHTAPPPQPAAVHPASAPAKTVSPQARPAPSAAQMQRRWRSLDNFVVGPCNRVAHASALSVVDAPGQDVNPLVLHGPVGVGKTHLLEGIFAGLRQQQPGWRVLFTTAEEFTHRFVQGFRHGKLSPFRKMFRDTDVLLVDDVNFLAKKTATQEEFVHTLDSLLRQGRQVVVTCDCHPRLADVFVPELADRLGGGAAWGLTLPDRETRLGILRAKAARLNRETLSDEVLCYLADQLRGNVRELEGALNSVLHLGRVAARPIDLGLAQEAVAELLRHSVRLVQLADVERAVCSVLRLDAGVLTSRRREWASAQPRMLAMFLGRKHTAATYAEIGKRFGRNHSTAVVAEKKVRAWLQDNTALRLGEGQVPVRDLLDQVERELRR